MLELYRKRLQSQGKHMGEVLKKQSDTIMDKTFTRDIAYRLCYIDDKPVDAKYLVHTYPSLSGDAVDYHILFRPGVHYPVGKYIDIPDDTGEYNRWLIVGRDDEPQFVKYSVLKCNWTFKWIVNGEIKECLGCLRKRLSYNSGLWLNYLVTIPENQTQFIVPYNLDTETISYNMRFLISVNQKNPVAWEVSKVEDTTMPGIIYITLKQDLFDPAKDNKDLMIANYYKSNVEPVVPPSETPEMKIIYSGQPVIKVGGSYKIFNVSSESNLTDGSISWKLTQNDEEVSSEDYSSISMGNTFKLKAAKNYNLIGEVYTLELYYNEELKDSVKVEVIGL